MAAYEWQRNTIAAIRQGYEWVGPRGDLTEADATIQVVRCDSYPYKILAFGQSGQFETEAGPILPHEKSSLRVSAELRDIHWRATHMQKEAHRPD